MKEIGTFKIDKNMCSNCREDENCPQKYSANGNCLHIEKGLVIEQVPENWEELKELCKKLKLVVSKNINMEKDNEYIVCCWMNFYEYGDILDSDGYAIAENRTPAQMWAIIKNLKGEE